MAARKSTNYEQNPVWDSVVLFGLTRRAHVQWEHRFCFKKAWGGMRFEILAFYGGPDQVMSVTSGLAGVLGLLLIFWNKVVAAFFSMIRFLRRSEQSAVPRLSDTDSKSAS